MDDKHYRKYLSNIKSESNNNSKIKKIINRKSNSNSQNKISNYDSFNIIQIYEAPPLELTPIEENEKDNYEEIRKKPKYYRKKKYII